MWPGHERESRLFDACRFRETNRSWHIIGFPIPSHHWQHLPRCDLPWPTALLSATCCCECGRTCVQLFAYSLVANDCYFHMFLCYPRLGLENCAKASNRRQFNPKATTALCMSPQVGMEVVATVELTKRSGSRAKFNTSITDAKTGAVMVDGVASALIKGHAS